MDATKHKQQEAMVRRHDEALQGIEGRMGHAKRLTCGDAGGRSKGGWSLGLGIPMDV